MTNIASLLEQILKERRQRNGSYSLRAFARDLGVKPGPLSEMMTIWQHVYLHKNGRIAQCNLSTPLKAKFNGILGEWQYGTYTFYADGTVESYSTRTPSELILQGVSAFSTRGSFYSNGLPSNMTITRISADLPIGSYFFNLTGNDFEVTYHQNGNIQQIKSRGFYPAELRVQKEPCDPKTRRICINAGLFNFGEDGILVQAIKTGMLRYPGQNCPFTVNPRGQWDTEFYSNGIPRTWNETVDFRRKVDVSGCVREKPVSVLMPHHGGFYENGIMKEGYLMGDTLLDIDATTSKTFRNGCSIKFDINGFASGSSDCIVP